MDSSAPGPHWPVRLARVGAAALAVVAILTWVTPINARSRTGMFGCGSASDPRPGGDLVDLVCRTDLDHARTITLALLIAAGAVLFLSEFVAPRFRAGRPWLDGVLVVSPVALAVAAVSAALQFTAIGGTTQEGLPFRCGTAVRPATDEISTLVCGQLAETRLVLGIGGMVVGLGLLAAGAYVAGARPGKGADA